MSETVVWNKKLLVVALGLGVAAAGLVYWRSWSREEQARQDRVTVLKWKVDRRAGQEVAAVDIGPVPVPRKTYENLAGVLENTRDNNSLAIGGHLSRDVKRDDFVRASDILEHNMEVPSQRIKNEKNDHGYRAFPLEVDPKLSLGNMLRVDDRIDILGLVSVGGKPARAYPLIENVRVLGVGGRSESAVDIARLGSGRRGRLGSNLRVYRTLAIEVHKATAVQLVELLPRVRGKLWIIVRHPKETGGRNDGKINPALLSVLAEPLPDGVDLD